MDGVGKLIGSGGYSKVYGDGKIATKVIENIPSAISEIVFTNSCNHDNVIKFDAITYSASNVKIKMKQYDGDLHQRMKSGLELIDIYTYARDIISAVAHVHSRGIIHADIKPYNILIDGGRAVLCDFGISLRVDEKYHFGSVQTSSYRAPEVIGNDNMVKFTAKIDMWSIGCILYEMASGNAFMQSNNDSSLSASHALQIQPAQTRQKRMQILRDVSRNYIIGLLRGIPRYSDLFDIGYIGLIANCLLPNHNSRIDANTALSVINGILDKCTSSAISVEPLTTPPTFTIPPTVMNYDIDDMTCIINIDAGLISLCTKEHLNLAEFIYRSVNEPRVEMQYAALYVASCVYTSNLYKNICNHIKKVALYAASIIIMIKLNNKII